MPNESLELKRQQLIQTCEYWKQKCMEAHTETAHVYCVQEYNEAIEKLQEVVKQLNS